MTCLEENVFLILSVLDLVLADQQILVDPLHCMQLPTILICNEEHFSKRSFVYNLDNLEVTQLNLSTSWFCDHARDQT